MTNLNVDDVPETDAEVDAILDANSPAPQEAPEAPAEDPAPEHVPPRIMLTPPAPRTGNAAWADEDERSTVTQLMAALREDGYTRPEISAFTGFSDSQVYRAQHDRVHTRELETWLTFFELYKGNKLPPPAASMRKPKVEVLQAKIAEVEAKVQRALEALDNPEVKTVKQYRELLDAVQATLSA